MWVLNNHKGKKMDKQKSKKIVLNTLKNTGATVVILAGMVFIVASFITNNTLMNEQYMRFKQDAERAFKRALQQHKNPSDTIAYNAQKSR